MTDVQENLPAERESVIERLSKAVMAPTWDSLDALVEGMTVTDLEDVLLGMSMRARADSLVSGRVAYEIRKRTPDGAWGQEVRKLATSCQVSDRTIHRWMSAYQDAAGLELTPAQENARSQQAARQQAGEPAADGSEFEYEDEDELEEYGQFLEAEREFDPNDGNDGALKLRESVGEPWAERDSVTPSTKYENPPDAPPSRRVVLPIDDTWSAFQQSQVVEKSPHLEGTGARRIAVMRWDEMVRTDPLGLLEELEMIHEGQPPDDVVAALYAAEEQKAIKPDQVEQPKKKRESGQAKGKVGASGTKNCENGLVFTREMHAHVVKLLEEGGPDAVASAYGGEVGTIQSWQHTLGGVLTKVRSAVEEVKRRDAGSGNPPAGTDF